MMNLGNGARTLILNVIANAAGQSGVCALGVYLICFVFRVAVS